jgi:hypothetical protein
MSTISELAGWDEKKTDEIAGFNAGLMSDWARGQKTLEDVVKEIVTTEKYDDNDKIFMMLGLGIHVGMQAGGEL